MINLIIVMLLTGVLISQENDIKPDQERHGKVLPRGPFP